MHCYCPGSLRYVPVIYLGELARFTPGGTRGGVGILWGVVLLCEAALVDSLLCWRGVIWVDIDNLSLHRKTNQQYDVPENLNPPTALQGHRKRINLSSARSTCRDRYGGDWMVQILMFYLIQLSRGRPP